MNISRFEGGDYARVELSRGIEWHEKLCLGEFLHRYVGRDGALLELL